MSIFRICLLLVPCIGLIACGGAGEPSAEPAAMSVSVINSSITFSENSVHREPLIIQNADTESSIISISVSDSRLTVAVDNGDLILTSADLSNDIVTDIQVSVSSSGDASTRVVIPVQVNNISAYPALHWLFTVTDNMDSLMAQREVLAVVDFYAEVIELSSGNYDLAQATRLRFEQGIGAHLLKFSAAINEAKQVATLYAAGTATEDHLLITQKTLSETLADYSAQVTSLLNDMADQSGDIIPYISEIKANIDVTHRSTSFFVGNEQFGHYQGSQWEFGGEFGFLNGVLAANNNLQCAVNQDGKH